MVYPFLALTPTLSRTLTRFAKSLKARKSTMAAKKRLLMHIEIQDYRESDFPKRVYHCNYRISDRCGEEVTSVALLTDDDPEFRENVYRRYHGSAASQR